MLPKNTLRIADAVLSSIEPGTLSDETILKLRSLLPDALIVAALDLIDREHVTKYSTPWGRVVYEVLGSTATYTVFPDLSNPYCTCPAFAYAVLISESHLMCKHVLATRLAQQLSRCVERVITADDLAIVISRQYT